MFKRLLFFFALFAMSVSAVGQGVSYGVVKSKFMPLVESATQTAVTIPSGLGWDSANYPLAIKIGPTNALGLARGSLAAGSFDYTQHPDYVAAATSGNVIYVDINAGDNSNNGSSWALAKKSIWKGQEALNALGPGTIYVKGGGSVYDRAYNFSDGTVTNVATQHTIFVASGGRVVSTTRDYTPTGWALDGTYTNCYVHSGTISNAPSRVLNLTAKVNGLYPDFAKAASAENCNATPWSWWYESGTSKLYINRGDGQAVTLGSLGTTAIYRQQSNFAFSGSTQKSIFLLGETDADGFDFEGTANTTTAACFTYTSSAARESGKTLIYARNCSFRYAGFINGSQTNNNGVSIDNFTGLACFVNCDASGNGCDGFNFHDTNSYGVSALTLNCTGNWNGIPNQRSCNGWTSHEGVVGIDVGGRYGWNAGNTVHSINTTKTLLVGTYAHDSRGDRIHGGTFFGAEFRVDNTGEMWCFGTRGAPSSAVGLAYQTTSTAAMHLKDVVEAIGGRSAATGSTIDTYESNADTWTLDLVSPEIRGIIVGLAFAV